MSGGGMKSENWVIGAGGAVVGVLAAVALLPDDLWDDDSDHYMYNVPAAAVAPGPMAQPQVPVAQAPVSMAQPAMPAPAPVMQAPMMVAPQAAAPAFDQAAAVDPMGNPVTAQNVALTGLVPFERAVTEPYRGQVQQVFVLGGDQGWGQTRIWVSDVTGAQKEISMGPGWYIQYLGCSITEGTNVRGVAFRFDTVDPSAVLYAKEVIVNGVRCRLRNDEGFALWSNQLR